MGGCFSVSLPCSQVVNQFSQWLCVRGSYVHNLSQNLDTLRKAMGVLRAKRDDVQGRVEREEFTGSRQRLSQIQVWLTDVLTSENKFSDLLNASDVELQRLCLCGFCSKNVKMSYLFGKRIVLALREIESLISQGGFDVVTDAAPIPQAEELPIQPTIVGQETMLDIVWNRLMGDRVGIVGLYGMGGVGKTTLLTQINNKFSEIGCGFDIVIWVVVSKYATVRKIQGDIRGKLGLGGKEWDDKNENQRAIDIHKVLKRKKFVLFLDDIWEKVNLNEIGIPYPNGENGCRVAFTTRSRDVCGRMGVNEPIQVLCLEPDKAWNLFKEKVGVDTLESHPDIPDLARKVAGKCDGLPLALNLIGETMASKNTVQEWHRVIDVLTSYAAEFSSMEDEILPVLKYSYDSLNGERVKTCFLYCSLFPEDFLIGKEKLIEYWISEGFIDENEGRERAVNQGYEILGTLVRACLLLDVVKHRTSYVQMHDVVREMALWIASDLGKHKERCIVKARVGLRKLPKVKNWKNVTRLSLIGNEIEQILESLECPQLTTLLLQENHRLTKISGEFFQSMSRLLVLDLSYNRELCGLPEQISELDSLRYLNLSHTEICQLPGGLQELKMLIHLNLENTYKLESLHGISNLSSLRTLKLWSSKVWLDMSLMKELQHLQQLEFISIKICSSLVRELLLYDPRVGRCIKELCIEDHVEESVGVLVLPYDIHKLFLDRCGLRDIKIEKIPLNKNLSFSNLSRVELIECHGLKELTWLLFAPNLIHLELWKLKQIEDIISTEKAATFSEMETCIILPFRKLERLHLNALPKLKSIYWNALAFKHLKVLEVRNCSKLRKLPLDSKSVSKVENFTLAYKDYEWIQEIEWEGEATRRRFLPTCTRFGVPP